MLRLLREIGFCLLVLLTASFLVFIAMRLMPGDPTSMADQVRQQAGFDRPLLAQYVHWWSKVLFHFDFDSSFSDGASVKTLLAAHAWKTGLLTLLAMSISVLLAVPLGVGHAFHESSRLWKFLFTFFDSISSLPAFVTAYLVIWLFVKLISPHVPTNPETESSAFGWIVAFALMASVLAVADGALGEVARLISVEIRELLDREFILSLRARGLGIGKHLFKNALIPIFSFLMSRMTYFLSGAVVIEKIFSFEGLGYLTLQSAENRDAPVLLGICFVLVSFVLLCHFISELVTNLVNPYRE